MKPAGFFSRHSLLLVLAIVFAASIPRAAAQSAPEIFKDGDRWCMIGDSITHSGTYHEWIWLYYLTRFPDRTIEAYNCGISGDTAAGGVKRLSWDVLPKQPTVASVMFGMNDVGRTLYNDNAQDPDLPARRQERIESYKKNQRALVTALQSAGARVVLVTPSIFDDTVENDRPKQTGVDDTLAECSNFVASLAVETGATLVDFHGPMDRINSERQRKDPKFTVVGPDRIHPGPPGHLLMAYLFLQAQRVPADVARLAIDLGLGRVTESVNGVAENIVKNSDGLMFTWLEGALPFPVSRDVAPALEWIPFTKDLNQEILQVKGLKAGTYELHIDGTVIRRFTADEFARGINLAVETNTPQYQQAMIVARFADVRTKLVADNLRGIAHVEHQSAPDIEHPVTLEQMQPFLEKRRAAFEQNPPATGTRRSVELYPDRKMIEVQSTRETARLAAEARRMAKPISHIYLIKLVR